MMLLLASGGILSFDGGFAIWVLITMIIFLWVINKNVVPPISEPLNGTEGRMRDSLESSNKALERAEKISAHNDKALPDTEVKAQEIRNEAIEDAEELREERI